ncbi:hypothetical protein [Mesorhizobium sp.]|uniref:hypothetical protein n=1 Tax=Mesorhizobium sp. TaxID=1871066 RepID=UPI001223B16B|nr:hypothetical protein [Mesorhizobium sp.]TIL64498.1 MAG: hypothetical protein E5Y77_26290 [Mesorhizobium sp.]
MTFNEVPWPTDERKRELMIARAFMRGFDHHVIAQSAPSLAPFEDLVQNDENDIDFTVMTSQGRQRMELAEVAPLKQHGGNFAKAPRSISTKQKAEAVVELVAKKSMRQGDVDRFLVLYATEQGFKVDVLTVERLRRHFEKTPPKFERVFFAGIHADLTTSFVSELFPGTPHHWFAGMTDEQLDGKSAAIHPLDMQVFFGDITAPLRVFYDGLPVEAQMTMSASAGLDLIHKLQSQPEGAPEAQSPS